MKPIGLENRNAVLPGAFRCSKMSLRGWIQNLRPRQDDLFIEHDGHSYIHGIDIISLDHRGFT
jgi:hypothetical protein